MERSFYVMTAPGDDGRTLMYSMANGAFASVAPEVADVWRAAGGGACEASELSGTATSTADTASPYMDQLAAAGFLVEDAAAERKRLFEQFRQQRADTHQLRLCLAPTYACNCRCAYCYEADKAAPWTFMAPEVEQAVYDFVEARFLTEPFEALDVQWYGGDPQLCLDVVARMAKWLWDFCQERGLAYSSTMLSNCTRIGAAEAQVIADAHVESILITIDGPERVHNVRRPTVDGGNPYQLIKAAIGFLQAAGVCCSVMCNCDKNNLPLVPELQKDLEELGVTVALAKLNDYGHTYGCERFCGPQFDLFTHEEFHQASHDAMKSQGQLTRDALRGILSPCDHFCSGQLDNYFVIDAVGDVYACDGYMGDRSHALFNLLKDDPVLHAVSFDPTEDAECGNCRLLPVCWGNCRWERECCGMPCHPLKTAGEQYLRDYAACFPPAEDPFVRWA